MNTVHDSKNTLLVVLAATVAQMVVAMSNVVLPTIAPKLAESLGLSPILIGYQVSLTFGTATVASMFGGTAVLRWGAARMTQVSMGACGAGLLLFLLPHWGFIVLGSVAVGAAMGLLTPAAAHMLVKYTRPEQRNLVFSIKQTGVPLGGVIIALTAPALAVTVGWQWSITLVIALIVVLALLVAPRRTRWDDDRDPGASLRQQPFGGVPMVWRHAGLRWLSLVALLFSAIQRCLLTFTVIYLVAEADYGLIEAGGAERRADPTEGSLRRGGRFTRCGERVITACALVRTDTSMAQGHRSVGRYQEWRETGLDKDLGRRETQRNAKEFSVGK